MEHRAHHGHAPLRTAVPRRSGVCGRGAAQPQARMTIHDTSPLAAEVRRLIKLRGPMPLARYMSLCLTHPQHGYYMSRDPFGVSGDFTTAPEISQMFGELIGLWGASAWQSMGSPESIN